MWFLGFVDVPSAPGVPSAEIQSQSSAHLKWTAPSSDNGSRITHYIIEYRMQGFFHWREEKTSSPSTNYTVQGLSKNSTYTFRVKAVNAAGNSVPSDECEPVAISPVGCKCFLPPVYICWCLLITNNPRWKSYKQIVTGQRCEVNSLNPFKSCISTVFTVMIKIVLTRTTILMFNPKLLIYLLFTPALFTRQQ